jgi:hypothetical protein
MSLVGAVGLAAGIFGAVSGQARPAAAGVVLEAPAQPVIIPDADITAAIQVRVGQVWPLRNSQVIISTKNGTVTLVGSMPTAFARDQMLEIARTTAGVRVIDNQLRLDVGSPQAPQQD